MNQHIPELTKACVRDSLLAVSITEMLTANSTFPEHPAFWLLLQEAAQAAVAGKGKRVQPSRAPETQTHQLTQQEID